MATPRPRRNKSKSFPLTLAVVGATGLGKSTYIETLCDRDDIYPKAPAVQSAAVTEKTLGISVSQTEVELENGNTVNVSIVDFPGFGDSINNESHFSEIYKYIEEQYDEVLEEEVRVKRNPRFLDNRVHALLYFIAPTGHSLREIDIEFMKKLCTRVNIIPIIAKSDTMLPDELATFKQRVMEDIKKYEIKVYSFDGVPDEDEEIVETNRKLQSLVPFAVVGSNGAVEMNGGRVRVRQYPWGRVEVDNPAHCDVLALENALFIHHVKELRETTNNDFYEAYRTSKLTSDPTAGTPSSTIKPVMDDEVRAREERVRREEEAIRKAKEELAAKEAELRNLAAKLSNVSLDQ